MSAGLCTIEDDETLGEETIINNYNPSPLLLIFWISILSAREQGRISDKGVTMQVTHVAWNNPLH